MMRPSLGKASDDVPNNEHKARKKLSIGTAWCNASVVIVWRMQMESENVRRPIRR